MGLDSVKAGNEQEKLKKKNSTKYSHPLSTNYRTAQYFCVPLSMLYSHFHESGSYSMEHLLEELFL